MGGGNLIDRVRRAIAEHVKALAAVDDAIVVGEDALLGKTGAGREILDRVLDTARIGAAAELLGLSLEAFSRTVEYLRDRKQFGVAIGSFQALQHRAAKIHAELELGRSVVLKALQLLDAGSDTIIMLDPNVMGLK